MQNIYGQLPFSKRKWQGDEAKCLSPPGSTHHSHTAELGKRTDDKLILAGTNCSHPQSYHSTTTIKKEMFNKHKYAPIRLLLVYK